MKKLLIIILILIGSSSCISQIKRKTTEMYLIEIPQQTDNIIGSEIFVIWDFDLENNKIISTDRTSTEVFHFTSLKPSLTEADDVVFSFNSQEKTLTLLVRDGNFVRIQVLSQKVPGIKSYKKMKVYTNYVVNNFDELFED